MSSFITGQIVEARCSRCKDITGHVVMACMNGVPVKVECRACGSVHKYNAPEPPARVREEKTMRVRAGNSRTEAFDAAVRAVRPKTENVPKLSRQEKKENIRLEEAEQRWNKAMAVSVGTPIPYNMNVHVAEHSLVEHPAFGTGIVLEFFPPDKMDVLFRGGIKRLRCA